jgi:hypothetical protein
MTAVVLAALLVLTAPAAAQDEFEEEAAPVAEEEPIVVVPEVSAPYGSSHLCDVAGAGANIKAGGFSVSVPTYPCEVARTYETLDGLEERSGFLAVSSRFFLKTRLVARGIFSSVFGLFGLG